MFIHMGKYCLSFYYWGTGGRGGGGDSCKNKICSAKPVKIDEKVFVDGSLKFKIILASWPS